MSNRLTSGVFLLRKTLFLLLLSGFVSCESESPGPVVSEPVYTVAAPCTSASELCIQTISFTGEDEREARFHFYSNYPILNDTAIWGNLKYAIIVIHGQNRDADNYFTYLTATLAQMGLSDSTVLIAPYFKSNTQADPGDLFWPSDWRIGVESNNSAVRISSFTAIDSLVSRLAEKQYFPFLERVIISGHSSGALLTQLYAATNSSDSRFESGLDYIVANSQYFYYPEDVRFNPSNGTFAKPGTCPGYNRWPYGFEASPESVEKLGSQMLNDQFVRRRITYLLGTHDTQTSGTLNTEDCEAVLLGRHRLNRGENMYLLMEEYFAGVHQHQKVLVKGIGHDGKGMYSSTAFSSLFVQLLTQ